MIGQTSDDWARRLTEVRQLMAEQAASLDASGDFPRDNIDRLRQRGFLSLAVPQQYGGAGAGLAELQQAIAAIAWGEPATALIVCGIVYLMTKNGFVSLLLAAVLEAGLIGAYLWDSSRFEGLFPQIISQLSLFARFYTIVNGVFDVTAIVYYLSVTGFFLFLSVQSLEKRRWSE